ncbi:DUF881 domain-containing protein [Niallia taxi]|uniref:DUF881 domain-containing protein n=1 Tax=Niallia taxi TaxID=2499688 RepID=UPI001247E8A9|nr:DUF881 domain-containing protein [Niallia taxi]MCT2344198.1 DUF881 domain-containing protein [Niallia taxi]MDE5051405.1 DUF881 domain-containing protein [Niallia taxi]MDK8638738.1 DUF881 domain-containing protein [Niallia taxi]MED4037723.1 DUF881 domain-containing protein [Niallia taxi]MED4053640.1 DUF881 domain-containing protein [Niallia taxi]
MKNKRKGSHVIFSFVFLVLGFIVAFAFQVAQADKDKNKLSDSQFDRDLSLRNELIDQEEKNNQLFKDLEQAQKELSDYEKELSTKADSYYNLAEDANNYRMYLGKMPVQGKGVQVTLEDGNYNPNDDNVNNYLVHEHHIFQVVNELYVSGATAISINGQRLSHDSYILCNGPVIEIDGNQYPAPFVVTAIGDSEVMDGALNIKGGVKDTLVNENIKFTLEKKDTIKMDALRTN